MNIEKFIVKINEDEDFRNRFVELESFEAMLDFAASAGYELTDADINALQREIEYVEKGCTELPDDELDNVAGGFVFTVVPGIGTRSQPQWWHKLGSLFKGRPASDMPGVARLPNMGNTGNIASALPNVGGGQGIAATALPNAGGNILGVLPLSNKNNDNDTGRI